MSRNTSAFQGSVFRLIEILIARFISKYDKTRLSTWYGTRYDWTDASVEVATRHMHWTRRRRGMVKLAIDRQCPASTRWIIHVHANCLLRRAHCEQICIYIWLCHVDDIYYEQLVDARDCISSKCKCYNICKKVRRSDGLLWFHWKLSNLLSRKVQSIPINMLVLFDWCPVKTPSYNYMEKQEICQTLILSSDNICSRS